ncbi:hypothetical protein N8E87_00550 [Avibacterium paragallinarum]|uniref:hypothetical protein n=1 Tax=Avibacterium paragallinarum TaxID=728 RepID=UPI0021F79644|nr:hypothetical protein [Avibacterium paragallinarum]UXN37027.1 hypothetical protein N8E87_00550 [Avibacterium paragallinarum]
MENQQHEFQQHKTRYLAEKQALDNLLKEKSKTQNIIAALQQDLIEQANNAENKLEKENFISADDYVALKQAETGIKTRIEYYQAYLEEIDAKIYQQKERLFNEYQQILQIREKALFAEFNALFEHFSTEQKDTLNRLYLLLKYSGKVTANSFDDSYKGTLEYAVKERLLHKIECGINSEIPLDNEWELPLFVNRDELKTLAQKEKESKEQATTKTGFKKLIDNLH